MKALLAKRTKWIDIRHSFAAYFFLLSLALIVLETQTTPHWLVILLTTACPVYFLFSITNLGIQSIRKKAIPIFWLISTVLWFPTVSGIYLFNFPDNQENNKQTFSVLSYNVRIFNIYSHLNNNYKETKELIAFTQDFDADIKCLQEYWTAPENPQHPYMNVTKGFEQNGYYAYVQPKLTNSQGNQFGLAIFSRYPIIETGQLNLPSMQTNNDVIYADIDINGKKIRVYNAHLGSTGLSDKGISSLLSFPSSFSSLPRTRESIEQMFNQSSKDLKRTINFLKTYYLSKPQQTVLLKHSIETTPHPVILCGDLNEPPSGYLYRKLRQALTNTHEATGKGFAGTINKKQFDWIRIDQIFADKSFEIISSEVLKTETYSDHYPIVTKLSHKSVIPASF